jgi:hypothetical protein
VSDKFIVEVYKNLSYHKRRVFSTRALAVRFANDWHDSHYDDDRIQWDVQIIHPNGQVHQTNTNGNETE